MRFLARLFSPAYILMNKLDIRHDAMDVRLIKIDDRLIKLQKKIESQDFWANKKHRLRSLEIHIIHRCNLRCLHCSHFCDLKYDEEINFDLTINWLKLWATRLEPKRFRILGGEPLMESRLLEYIKEVANIFPKSRRDVVTNGLLLHRWEASLPEVLKETDTVLHISEHPMPPRLKPIFIRNLEMAKQWAVKYGFRLTSSLHTGQEKWTQVYRGSGSDIRPHISDRPEESRFYCTRKNCVNLRRGRLWPCPVLAYLPLVADKLTFREEWEPYINYQPLDFAVSDEELNAFLKGMHRHSADACGMCPSRATFITPKALPAAGQV